MLKPFSDVVKLSSLYLEGFQSDQAGWKMQVIRFLQHPSAYESHNFLFCKHFPRVFGFVPAYMCVCNSKGEIAIQSYV